MVFFCYYFYFIVYRNLFAWFACSKGPMQTEIKRPTVAATRKGGNIVSQQNTIIFVSLAEWAISIIIDIASIFSAELRREEKKKRNMHRTVVCHARCVLYFARFFGTIWIVCDAACCCCCCYLRRQHTIHQLYMMCTSHRVFNQKINGQKKIASLGVLLHRCVYFTHTRTVVVVC